MEKNIPLTSDENLMLAMNSIGVYLSARDHSLKELNDKLVKKYPPETVNMALEKAVSYGWIVSPKELAEKTAQMLNRKYKGFRYIRQYLKSKGLPPTERNEEIEVEKACHLINKHFYNNDEEIKLSYKDKQKAYRILSNRGFDHQTIKTVTYEIY